MAKRVSEIMVDVRKLDVPALQQLLGEVIACARGKRAMASMAAITAIKVGDKASFVSRKHGRIEGTIIKVNIRNVRLRTTTGVLWNVPASMITKA